jgi:HD-GYP domain-containing protein (c-di-GMP phosphodiesterase class II)/CHASE2 domain-containing sensor protein
MRRLPAVLISTVLAIFVGILFLSGFWERLELITLDLRFHNQRQIRFSDSLAVVGVTQGCLKELGGPPSRIQYANLISILSQAGARVIAFDVFFPPGPHKPENEALTRATKQAGNVIFPVFSPTALDPTQRKPDNTYPVEELQGSFPELENVSAGQGHINILTDQDQIARTAPANISYRNKIYPHLAISAVRLYRKNRTIPKTLRTLPLDNKGRYYINYLRPESIADSPHFFAFSKVLTHDYPTNAFHDKVVLVGQTIQGLQNADLAPTPFGYQFGVLVEASAINTILTRNFIVRPTAGWTLLLLLILGFMLGLSLFNIQISVDLIVTFVFLLLIVGGSFLFFQKEHVILEIVPLGTLVFTTYVSSLVVGRHRAIRQRKQSLSAVQRQETEIAALISPFSPLDDTGEKSLKISEDLRLISQTPHMAIRIFSDSMGASSAVMFTRKSTEERFTPLASFGAVETSQKNLAEIAEKTISDKKLLFCNRVSLSRNSLIRSLGKNITNILALPIISEGEVCAVIILLNKKPTLFSPSACFTQYDIQLATIMSLQTIVAIQNANLGLALRDAHLDTIIRLAMSVEYRDRETGEHINRLRDYATIIAFGLNLPDYEVDLIRNAIPMHDIGKIGIPDNILLKPGPLTPEERKIVQTHTTIGAQILSKSTSPVLQASEIVALCHHERYDGTGYPRGLAGEKIPLYGRIAAVADVFDAVCSKRCYKEAVSVEEGLSIISDGSGKNFDPRLVEIFLRNLPPIS